MAIGDKKAPTKGEGPRTFNEGSACREYCIRWMRFEEGDYSESTAEADVVARTGGVSPEAEGRTDVAIVAVPRSAMQHS